MKPLTRTQLRDQLSKRDFASLYLLHGEERYVRNIAAKTIAEKVLGDSGLNEFNFDSVSLAENSLADAISFARQFPMMSAMRVVKINGVERLGEDDEETLKSFLENPSPTSVVIFVADTLDQRRRISKLLQQKTTAVEFKKLNEFEIRDWAKRELKQLDVFCDDRVLNEITLLTGSDVARLTNELKKLATAALPDKIITSELVRELVADASALDNFELASALAEKSRRRALKILNKIFHDGGEPVAILGLIGNMYHRLYKAKEQMRVAASESAVAQTANVRMREQPEILAAARRADEKYLSDSIKRIAETDHAIKTSKAPPEILVEMLVVELTA
jgi:DNA polymerase-3 subunit delta